MRAHVKYSWEQKGLKLYLSIFIHTNTTYNDYDKAWLLPFFFQRENPKQVLRPTQDLTTLRLWPELRHPTDWATQVPHKMILKSIFYLAFEKVIEIYLKFTESRYCSGRTLYTCPRKQSSLCLSSFPIPHKQVYQPSFHCPVRIEALRTWTIADNLGICVTLCKSLSLTQ